MMRIQFEMKKLEAETRRAEAKEETRRAEIQADLRKAELDSECRMSSGSQAYVDPATFNLKKDVKNVPPFLEEDVDAFFQKFEKCAYMFNWPKEEWPSLLHHRLIGKALQAVEALSFEESREYECVKDAVLEAYELIPEAYRAKFRLATKKKGQSYRDVTREMRSLLRQWQHSQQAFGDFDKFSEMILVENFKFSLPNYLRVHLEQHDVNNLDEGGTLADKYLLVQKDHPRFRSETPTFPFRQAVNDDFPHNAQDDHGEGEPQSYQGYRQAGPVKYCQYCGKLGHTEVNCFAKQRGKTVRCTFCDKLGHRVENCFAKQEKEKHRGPVAVRPVGVARPVGLVAVERPGKWKSPQRAERARGTHKTDLYRPIPPRSGNSHPVRGTHRSFITDGFVSVGTDRRPVKVFRDTGSDQTILRAGVLGSMPYKESVVIKDVWCEQTAVPLVRVVVESKLRSGPVKAAILEKLPYSGVDLVVGNDFCGKRVYPNPRLSRKFVPYPKWPPPTSSGYKSKTWRQRTEAAGRQIWPGNCRVVATRLPRDLSV